MANKDSFIDFSFLDNMDFTLNDDILNIDEMIKDLILILSDLQETFN